MKDIDMRSHGIMLKVTSGMVLWMLYCHSAMAEYEPNDNYSLFILSFKSSKFAAPVCIGNECHESLSGPQITYAKQPVPNLALGLSGSQLNSSGKSSSIKTSNVSAFAQLIAGLGMRVDVGASAAVLNRSTELCTEIPQSCQSASDSGTDLGVFGKVFLNDKKNLSVTLGYNALNYHHAENQSIIGLAVVTILARHHRLALSADKVADAGGKEISGGLGFAYSYIVYY